MDDMRLPEDLAPGDVRRRAARTLALGLALFVPGLVMAALLADWPFVGVMATALGTIGLPLVVLGSYRLVFGAGGQSRSWLASIGRIAFGLIAIIGAVVLAFAALALFARR